MQVPNRSTVHVVSASQTLDTEIKYSATDSTCSDIEDTASDATCYSAHVPNVLAPSLPPFMYLAQQDKVRGRLRRWTDKNGRQAAFRHLVKQRLYCNTKDIDNANASSNAEASKQRLSMNTKGFAKTFSTRPLVEHHIIPWLNPGTDKLKEPAPNWLWSDKDHPKRPLGKRILMRSAKAVKEHHVRLDQSGVSISVPKGCPFGRKISAGSDVKFSECEMYFVIIGDSTVAGMSEKNDKRKETPHRVRDADLEAYVKNCCHYVAEVALYAKSCTGFGDENGFAAQLKVAAVEFKSFMEQRTSLEDVTRPLLPVVVCIGGWNDSYIGRQKMRALVRGLDAALDMFSNDGHEHNRNGEKQAKSTNENGPAETNSRSSSDSTSRKRNVSINELPRKMSSPKAAVAAAKRSKFT